MKLLDHQLDKASLARFGEEACQLLIARDFSGLAARFGYAMAYNLEPAAAIEMELKRCLSAQDFLSAEVVSVTVRYFKPGDDMFRALIECIVQFDNRARVLIELIVAANMNLYLEQISETA
ncbi:MAG: hypothetical protein ACTHLW_03600 [Verrucomicrobiota bacterium]